MVQLACACLNIRLHVREAVEALIPGVPNLTSEESKHPFFSKGACLANLNLGGISQGQKFLVRCTRVGGWTVNECLNCHLLTHANHNTNGSLAVSTFMINDANKIQMLQRCEGYSPVFCMVLPTSIDNRPLPPLSPTDFSDERSSRTEEALRSIQQQVAKFLKKAELQVEANIRQYTDQQQAALNALQARTRRDRQTIMRLLANVQTALDLQGEEDPVASLDLDGARGPLSDMSSLHRERAEEDLFAEEEEDPEEANEEPDTALPPLVNIQSRMMSQPMGMSQAQGITGAMKSMRLSSSVTVPRVKPQGNVRVAQSLDAEGLFDMDGMVEASVVSPQATYHSDEEDTDDSNHDEGIHIPRGCVPARDLAQSVPVNVPMWPSTRPQQLQREPLNIEVRFPFSFPSVVK
ncbi:uncharacterized protein LOC122257281 isoform X1 [Penaeus japonicus]|uniref:uncharacterized protein LOC122257281 isoform X1 n=1 Tax=Penaeus japonicus TaxID=27405 RepID=UPI001C7156D7|nr:uncharacterized protein LOC122257281 isoform X1 [Penaeus japonicus]XP_042878423.1 uncharacterized protein LOC122257281 isoform X1 [Penaeus japonicus]